MQILWLKRDLRLHDHEPLRRAFAEGGPVLPLYIHEPALITAADTSAQHGAFIRETLDELREEIAGLGGVLLEQIGGAVAVLERLREAMGFTHIWAHQETTTLAAFARDRAVKDWCGRRRVTFVELPQNAVSRGSVYRRDGFQYREHLDEACGANFWSPALELPWAPLPFASCTAAEVPLAAGRDKPGRLKGGRAAATKAMDEFVCLDRLLEYPTSISSPLSAPTGCSRLSPYLAYGVVSDREVFQRLNNFVRTTCRSLSENTAASLRSSVQFYADRVYWRSAYLQSLEKRPESEVSCDLAALEGVREADFEPAWLQAWTNGRTGMPMVDASMRMLAATGWLNMRMRGMVTSFAVNELWLPWRDVGLHLAREFLDYEPGIHWNQLQIHAGTSRLSGPLTYNAVKQAQDHDPQGAFVRRWVPELRSVPLEHIFEPWKMPAAAQVAAKCRLGTDYPAVLVPHLAANDAARSRVAALREGRPVPAQAYWKTRVEKKVEALQGGLF